MINLQKTLLVCTLIWIAAVSGIQGQSDQYLDKVVLKNGSVIWGIVETVDGNVKVYIDRDQTILVPDSLIKSLKTGKLNPTLYQERTLGIYYQISTGLLLGREYDGGTNEGQFFADFTTGYKFKRLLGVGLGAGLSYYPDQRHIPLHIDIQGDLLSSRVTPFYQVSTGFSWADERDSNPAIDRIEGGWYFRPSLGLKWHFAKHSWLFQVSYLRQESTTYYEPFDLGNGRRITNVEDRTFQRLGLSLGISF